MPATLSAIEREREAQHRAELALLLARVVPRPRPAVDLLVSLALPAASEPLGLLKIGHDERNLDFWDERKLAACVKRSELPDVLELTQKELDAVKAVGRAFVLAAKSPSRELDEPEWTASWLWPATFSNEVVLSRVDRCAAEHLLSSRADINVRELLAGEKPYPQSAFDSVADTIEVSDTLAQALDLGLMAAASDLAALKQKRDLLRTYHKKPVTESIVQSPDEAEWLQPSASAVVARIGSVSPPLFPRADERALQPDKLSSESLILSPWPVMEEPCSPRFTLEEDWQPRPVLSSPPTSEARMSSKERGGISSPADLPSLPAALTRAETPMLTRRGQPAKEDTVPTLDQLVAKGFRGSAYTMQCAESVASSTGSPSARMGLSSPLFGQEIEESYEGSMEGAKVRQAFVRAPYPHSLKVRVPELPDVKPETEFAGFPDQAAFDPNAGTPFALVPMTGLRSLTLELSWRAWSLPESIEIDSDLAGSLPPQEEQRDALAGSTSVAISPISSQPDLGPGFRYGDDDDDVLMPRLRSKPAREIREEDVAAERVSEVLEPDASDAFESVPTVQLSDDRDSTVRKAPMTDEYGFTLLPAEPACSQGTDDVAGPNTGPMSPGAHRRADLMQEHLRPAADPLPRAETGPPPVHSSAAPSDTLSALDRFLSLRGKHDLTRRAPALGEQALQRPARACHEESTATARLEAETASGPPSIPSLPVPAFLLAQADPPSVTAPCRIVAFDPVFQRREHVRALERKGLQLVHRPSRPAVCRLPDLIIDPTTCVTICRLVDLLKVGGTGEAAASTTTARPETIPDRIEHVAQDYEHVVVILEEQHERVAGRRISSYSKPILCALDRLGSSLDEMRNRGVSVEVAFSRSPEHTAETVGQLVSYKASKEQRESFALDLWSERRWLTSDPTEEETQLLQHGDVNELAACAILAVCSANDFLGMSSADRSVLFDPLLGKKTIERLNHAVGSTAQLSSDPVPPCRISAIDCDQEDDVVHDEKDKSGDSFDWTQFLKELSQ
ncbi:hypothetical protein JCM3774_004941 [Rhodotorula dairenensis]